MNARPTATMTDVDGEVVYSGVIRTSDGSLARQLWRCSDAHECWADARACAEETLEETVRAVGLRAGRAG